MKDISIFDEHFEDFTNNRFYSNTSEEIEKLETDFNAICSRIEKHGDSEIKKLLEHLFATHNDLLVNTIRKAYSLGFTDYIHLTTLSK